MPISNPPRVSVGLPVFNGENFLEEALQSLVAQDYDDFEILIGDNGSTDRTEEICRAFAARHPRVTYLRSEENLGAAWNYNRLVAPARGEYFIWIAHDDLFAPSLLRKSVELLDKTPDAVLCCAGVQHIDEHGEPLGAWQLASPRLSKDPSQRFGDVLRLPQWHLSFALIRRDVLLDTRLFGAYIAADGVFLAEMALRGRFVEITEPLFLNRQHAASSTEADTTRQGRSAWWDPGLRNKVPFPRWRVLLEYYRAVRLAPLSRADKMQAFLELWSWGVVQWKSLSADLIRAPRQFLGR